MKIKENAEERKLKFFHRAQEMNLDLANQLAHKNHKTAFDRYGISKQLKSIYDDKGFVVPMVSKGLGLDSRRNPPLQLRS